MSDQYSNHSTLSLAGTLIDCSFRFRETVQYFRRFLHEEAAFSNTGVSVSSQAFADWEHAGNAIDAFAEFCLLCQPVSEVLMDTDRCVFHAFALRYHGRAFLIAGGSGVGKTTYGKLLLERYQEEFSVINGDKPLLQYDNNSITVHPSPWSGKEGLHGAGSAPIGGIFFLYRGEEDSISRLSDPKAAVCAFPMVFQSFENETVIKKAGLFTEKIVRSSPCYLFFSRDIEESLKLLYHSINEALDNDL